MVARVKGPSRAAAFTLAGFALGLPVGAFAATTILLKGYVEEDHFTTQGVPLSDLQRTALTLDLLTGKMEKIGDDYVPKGARTFSSTSSACGPGSVSITWFVSLDTPRTLIERAERNLKERKLRDVRTRKIGESPFVEQQVTGIQGARQITVATLKDGWLTIGYVDESPIGDIDKPASEVGC